MHHLLIVDDHPLYRMALRQTLAAALPGARIDEAGEMAAAHAALEAAPETDLVLLDLQLPGTHGLLALSELRAAHPGLDRRSRVVGDERHDARVVPRAVRNRAPSSGWKRTRATTGE